MADETIVFHMGERAREAGKPITACGFLSGTYSAKLWREGWQRANDRIINAFDKKAGDK